MMSGLLISEFGQDKTFSEIPIQVATTFSTTFQHDPVLVVHDLKRVY